MTSRSAPKPPALLTSRSALVLLLAVLTGIGAGLLTYLARRSIPEAFLAAGAATGGAIGLFNRMIA
ncbi:hypothetical protein AB0L00_44795 [Actinoallomurus sp. NPDC052308]|uniref:hypothetical protein n=1 Tax=Actinoallomurus sp. NPDC052308 TaxID=3155530 RepID=UPI00343D3AE3